MSDYLVCDPVFSAPELLTPRTRMRGHRVDDFHAMVRMWSDEAVVRFISGRPSTPAETWSRLLRYIGHWRALAFGYWVVEDRETGAYLGEVGFADFKRDMEPSLDGIPEAGWALVPDIHGKGIATEAVRAALGWADAHFVGSKTACILNPDHTASVRVAEKCGFVSCGSATIGTAPVLLMERERDG
ncbi:RimJ/RimL family protein N-acetyltransferase [Ciceribacter lividus]|uniref:RimJ/RimL family protein N-acetyltransferase n=1 Tax=Ciceribacter lividus TaxID=1197950 RepID=A0A6I7HRZ8_9HYPH|nr:GNAT family N-acetyltransferase [Ciceribacter lividus]RCW27880.1 RimJ/RimL family protein N-acetyltransferase [Ciceribacter lividus]